MQRLRCEYRAVPSIRITVDGKAALTTARAAARYGLRPSSMRGELTRYGVEPVAHLDARTPLYLATEVAAMMKDRPGKGCWGQR